MNERPTWLSATGILLAVLLLAGVGGWVAVRGPGLFSPGPLNAQAKGAPLGGVASHAGLSADCGACHPAPWSPQTMAEACLVCHADVTGQIAGGKGIHGLMAGPASGPTCAGCHPDHRGPDAPLTEIDGATFPHDRTGFSLRSHRRTQTGARFTCADCHPKDILTFDRAVCVDCHERIDSAFMQRHIADVGPDCLGCHNGTGSSFSHSVFPLNHGTDEEKSTCATCHPNGAGTYTCFGCHAHSQGRVQSEHEGQSAQRLADCIRCHPGGRAARGD